MKVIETKNIVEIKQIDMHFTSKKSRVYWIGTQANASHALFCLCCGKLDPLHN
uniref:Uncharacterized protein n=1 Tax=Rhizophora mucronata TaxID=61149 RepID=A0A2P2PC59_RHIMU